MGSEWIGERERSGKAFDAPVSCEQAKHAVDAACVAGAFTTLDASTTEAKRQALDAGCAIAFAHTGRHGSTSGCERVRHREAACGSTLA